ncbi:hypothetical protein Taro_041784 [Colocasia esculenta]|uniref:NusB/RsmB/TIM44 domain-containing protein n=1 Tax=Colocasia esculenta TaxID=4460 RepID=A0A843WY77_COLES|nr:hypothetical protein [Colocasia esculenta]
MAETLSPFHFRLSFSRLLSFPWPAKPTLSRSPAVAEATHHLRAAGARQGRLSSAPRESPPPKQKARPTTSPSMPGRGRAPETSRPRKMAGNINLEVSPHRAVAAVRLLRVEQGGAFVDLLNEKGKHSAGNGMDYVERTLGFRTRELDNRDIRLVTEIVGGTVRWKRYLDHVILSLCNEDRMFRGMEPLLLQILRISFYEIIKLGMPPYAVLYENVKLAKIALRPGAGNLVNGLLRKLILTMETGTLPLPKVEGDDRAQARALAIIYSHPVWMVRRWLKYLGQEEAVKLMNWNNNGPIYSLRVNSANGLTRDDLIMRLKSLNVS